MVKKLFKYELSYYLKRLPLYYLVVMFTAAMARFSHIFEIEGESFNIIINSAVMFFCLSVLICAFMTVFNIITRFYKNMFSSEGYLTLTLPVTTGQHLFVKFSTAILAIVAAIVVAAVGFAVVTAGDLGIEILKATRYYAIYLTQEHGSGIWLLFGELAVFYIAFAFKSVLLFYACIAVGQLFSKKRVTAAIVVFLIYLFASCILQTIGVIFDGLVTAVLSAYDNNYYGSGALTVIYQIVLTGNGVNFLTLIMTYISSFVDIVVQIVLCIVLYVTTHVIVKKKVNLE